MRILALSDTHGHLPALDVSKADCVMIAGDVCPLGVQMPEVQRPWLECAFGSWVEFLGKPVFLTLGITIFAIILTARPTFSMGPRRLSTKS